VTILSFKQGRPLKLCRERHNAAASVGGVDCSGCRAGEYQVDDVGQGHFGQTVDIQRLNSRAVNQKGLREFSRRPLEYGGSKLKTPHTNYKKTF
jgi:hypothetical protein